MERERGSCVCVGVYVGISAVKMIVELNFGNDVIIKETRISGNSVTGII